MIGQPGQRKFFEGDGQKHAALQPRPGAHLPRIALFLFDWLDGASLQKMIERIPPFLDDWLEEVVVVEDHTIPVPIAAAALAAGRAFELRIHRSPRHYGYGGSRKVALEYAVHRGFDHVVLMRGDGAHPPEALPDLLAAIVAEPRQLAIASRFVQSHQARRAGTSWLRLLGHKLGSVIQNGLLGLELADYLSSFRAIPGSALRGIPFQLNSDDRTFDTELLIQCRALGVPVREVPARPPWQENGGVRAACAAMLAHCSRSVAYRLHQLHVTRDGRFLVDHGVHYTLKKSESSSHMQIVRTIRPGSRVLDLGCSQGLLARPLRDKGVRVTGVDALPPERVAADLDQYFQHDLEGPLRLPVERVFDYVVCADVIEHLRNRTQLLRGARRYLKESGRLVISTPNIALWFYRLSLAVGRFEYGPRGVLDETHVHLYTGSTFRREVERAGFRVLRQRVTALPFEVVFESTGQSALVRALGRCYHVLARCWPSMFAYQHILEAEITTLDEEGTRG